MRTFSKCTLLNRATLTWWEGLPILHMVALSVNHCVAVLPYVDGTKRPVFFTFLIFFFSLPIQHASCKVHSENARCNVHDAMCTVLARCTVQIAKRRVLLPTIILLINFLLNLITVHGPKTTILLLMLLYSYYYYSRCSCFSFCCSCIQLLRRIQIL